MPVIFEGTPGRVVRLDDPAAQGRSGLVSADPSIDFDGQLSIITRMTVSQQANVQFLHTMGAAIYIYVFGDRIGSISLSGLSFASDCAGAVAGTHGAEKMIKWYRDNRVAKRQTPIRVMIGDEPVEGFATAFTEDIVDTQSLLVQWGVTIQSLPDND